MPDRLDCIVVGGGPAGLTAAIYLARFRRRFAVIDGGGSRARWIPICRNYPGFPDGVRGPELLERLGAQAVRYGADIRPGRVSALEPVEGGFRLQLDQGEPLESATVILATGVVENEPNLPDCIDAVKSGLIRICPICDGYETVGKRVGVVGNSDHAAAEALFLRGYSEDVSLVLVGDDPALPPTRRRQLAEAGVAVIRTAIDRVVLEDGAVRAFCFGSEEQRFDTLYSAFGVTPQSALAQQAGARLDQDGRLIVGEHQETSIDGLFAAGDLVRGLNQIAVAAGEAALAATAVHNRLPRPYA